MTKHKSAMHIVGLCPTRCELLFLFSLGLIFDSLLRFVQQNGVVVMGLPGFRGTDGNREFLT